VKTKCSEFWREPREEGGRGCVMAEKIATKFAIMFCDIRNRGSDQNLSLIKDAGSSNFFLLRKFL
jgi:hypothetical protein